MIPSTHKEGRTTQMVIDEILAHGPKLTDGPLVTPQPSITDIVHQHYARIAGEVEGRQLADAYLERITERFAAAAPEAHAPANDTAPSAATAAPRSGAHAPAPDKTPARTLLHALVQASQKAGVPATVIEVERARRRWAEDARLVAIYPALGLTDAEGGISDNVESPMSVRSLLRGLVHDGFLVVDQGRYAVAAGQRKAGRTTSSEADAARPGEGPAERTAPAPDPMAGIREVFRDVGIDLKIGDVDLIGGMRRVSEGGSAAPLLTGLAGVVIGAIAAAEARRPKA